MDTKRVGSQNVANSAVDGVITPQPKAIDPKIGGATNAAANNKDFSVNLSKKAKDVAAAREKAMGIAMATNPVREDRVKEIQAKIKNGTYQVDSGKIADGMMIEAIRDKLANTPDE